MSVVRGLSVRCGTGPGGALVGASASWRERCEGSFGGSRDGSEDVAAACVLREALETLKFGGLAAPWDECVVKVFRSSATGGAFAGWFGLDELEAACDSGHVSEAGRGVLGPGGAWQMTRVGGKGRAVAWPEVAEVLDASATVVLNSLDATCPRVAALSLAAIDRATQGCFHCQLQLECLAIT